MLFHLNCTSLCGFYKLIDNPALALPVTVAAGVPGPAFIENTINMRSPCATGIEIELEEAELIVPIVTRPDNDGTRVKSAVVGV